MNQEKFHFIGIGGIGMSGLARILLKKQVSVSGSDIASSYVTEGLKKEGAHITFGHASQNIPENATVVYSTDIREDNPEYQAAIHKKYLTLHRSDLLLLLMKSYKTLSVTGTHGKTTTSSLLAWVMHQGQKDPCFAVGGMIPQFQSNAGYGKGDYFVAEADESDGTFLKYDTYGAIVTNINSDHLNHYGSMTQLIESFKSFLDNVKAKEHLFWCGDNDYLNQLKPEGISYGFNHHCQLHVYNFRQQGWKILFDINWKGHSYKDIELSLIGRHNALNGAAVFGLALSLGVSENDIRKAFSLFGGVMRRAEKKGEIQNILFLDDYAHHPTEIKTTLQGIRQALGGRRLIVVFQPHRYSRTKDCLGGLYKGIFEEADELFVTEIYAAGEKPIAGVSSTEVIKEIESDGLTKCRYIERQKICSVLKDFVHTHDVVVTFGAGDITKLSIELLNEFKLSPPKKLNVGIIFGGRSTEHEISFLSAQHICQSVKSDYYNIHHFGITKAGDWISGLDSLQRLKQNLKSGARFASLLEPAILNELMDCDVVVPVFHGPYGEDGTIQGFLEILNKAYVGPDHTSAALAMDKGHTKNLMLVNDIPTLPFVKFNQKEWKETAQEYLHQIEKNFTFPLFVKPVHLGSAVGVQKVDKASQLKQAIEDAFKFDYKLIIEQGLVNHREIEFAVLGNETPKVFPPGEVLGSGQMYDYEAKYGPNGMKSNPKADLNQKLIEEGMNLALKAYKAIDCTGMARVDFFLDSNEKFWLNEINPIPGFTQISLYPKICEVNGLGGKDLLDQLIILALERQRRNRVLARHR